jgi:hypothetical protein
MRCPGCYSQPSSSFLILSFTSRSVITPLRILTGVPCPVLRFFTSSSFSHFAEGDGGHAALEEAIWTHSALSITMDLRKSGQRLVRRRRDSIASAAKVKSWVFRWGKFWVQKGTKHVQKVRTCRNGRTRTFDNHTDYLFDGDSSSPACWWGRVRGWTLWWR